MIEESTESEQDGAAVNDGGAPVLGPADWKQELPEDLREDATVRNLRSLPDAMRMLVHAQKMIGADKLALPKGEDDPAWDAVYDRLGRPQDPESYELPAQGETLEDTAFGMAMRSAFHEAGLSQRQAARLAESYQSFVGEALAARDAEQSEAFEAEEAALRKSWGVAYDARLDQAQRAARRFAKEPVLDALEGAVGRAAVLRMFARIGAVLGEDDLAGAGSGDFALTPEAARAGIDAFKLDREKFAAYLDRGHPGHAAAVAEMKRLHEGLG